MSSVITVEIAGQRYPIRSSLDERYVAELAAYVDTKMRAAADAAPTSDLLGLAVLVALNIADEYFRARDQQSSVGDAIQARTLRLEQLVDEALGAWGAESAPPNRIIRSETF
jgi:cell division protein ZapA